MKILIVPMMAMTESSGPKRRAHALAEAATRRGWKAITPTLPTPSPLGLPPILGKHCFPLAQKLGINRHARITSFDEVLWLTGNTSGTYLRQAIHQLRTCIQDSGCDAVYSEFSLPGILAARTEGVPIFGSTSFPTLPTFANNPAHVDSINKVLRELHLDSVHSPEEILLMPDHLFVPSCPELEPFPHTTLGSTPLTFTGPFYDLTDTAASKASTTTERNLVVAYFGNSALSPKRALRVLEEALCATNLTAYVAGLPEQVSRHTTHVHTAPTFDFSTLLPRAIAFINHGGQNSLMDGIRYETPQLICPGNVFERQFNAQAATRAHLGQTLEAKEFTPCNVRAALMNLIAQQDTMRNNAHVLRERLVALGGANAVLDTIEHTLAH